MAQDYPVVVLGHRGYRKLFPENTLLAFKKAVEFGADGVELDIRKAKDGSIVVIHDQSLERMSGDKRTVAELNYFDIKKVKLHSNQFVPTLDMVYAELPEDSLINVELKEIETAETALQIINSFNAFNRTLFSSFIPEALYKIRELNKEAYLGLLVSNQEELSHFNKINQDLGLYSLNLPLDGIKMFGLEGFKDQISKVMEQDIKVILWNFEDTAMIKELKGYYDVIITDNVEGIINELQKSY